MPEEETAVQETTETVTAPAPDPEAPSFSWREHLADDIDQSDLSLQTIHGTTNREIISALAKQHINAQKAIGRDKISIPGKDASDEEMRLYYTQTGCPETPDGYAPPTENISDKFDVDLFNGAREEAHRLGVRPDQLAGLARFLDSRQAEAREASDTASTAQVQEWEAAIQKEHGGAFAQNTAMAKAIIHEYGGDEMETLLEDRGLGSHPALFNMLTKIGRALGEDEVVGQGGTYQFVSTPDQAAAEWAQLQLDKEFMAALNSNEHPGHKVAFEKQTALFKLGAGRPIEKAKE